MNEHTREELLELLSELADNDTLAPEQAGRLEEILASSADARLLYMQHIDLQVELSCMAGDEDGEDGDVTVSFSRPQAPPRRWWPMAVAAAVVFALIFVLRGGDDEVIARLDNIKGDVLIVPEKGLPWSPDNTLDIRASYTLRLRGDDSSAVLIYPDGTLVALVGKTELGFDGGDEAKNLLLPSGVIAASVTKQPDGAPLTVATQTAEIEVVGTEFTLESDAANTHLAVLEGAVDFIRNTDTSRVQVAQGEVATVGQPPAPGTAEPELVASAQMPPPVDWRADFETGLPAGWRSGDFVSAGLPGGSAGAVAESRTYEGDRVYYQIEAPSSFIRGLYQIDADTHLHITYKMAYPDWVNIFIGARSQELRETTWHTYKNVDINAGTTPPGVWQTITIPLKAFTPAGGYGEPILGKIPFGLLFSSTPKPRGLVIDAVWVTQGGPGETVVEKIVSP